MRRPRHRVKSNLLWKMLALAALVNLLVWPILIRLGVFSGIRREMLIPVTLVSQPAPPKAPDALAKVPKPTLAASRPAASPVRTVSAPVQRPVAAPPVMPPKAPPVLVATAPAVRRSHHAPPSPSVAKPRPETVQVAARIRPSKPSRPTLHVAATPPPVSERRRRPIVAAKAEPIAPPHESLSSTVVARRERAARLEREGRQVAEEIAAKRAAAQTQKRQAAEAPVKPKTPEPSPVSPKTPEPQKVAVVPPDETQPAPSTESKPPPTDETYVTEIVPAVAVVKVQPAVPESMQDSAWTATFRGVFNIKKDGSFTVSMTSSTGKPILDRRALSAARRWKFRPATEDGVPVPSTVKFEIIYAVNQVP